MKRALSVIIALSFILGLCAFVSADGQESGKLKFNSEGKFRIMMLNDTQDVGKNVNSKMTDMLEKALDTAKPDLVVFVGDQLSDMYPNATKEDIGMAIDNICSPIQERGIPFAVTLGNHDHDREDTATEEEQYEFYSSYSCCQNVMGADYFTFNVPVYSSDGEKLAFNVYMMDTNNKANGGYEGVRKEQVEWYREKSDSLKEENGGQPVPSLLFQHVPVKEIYSLLKECKWYEKDAVFSMNDYRWYVLDEDRVTSGVMGEAPCPENFDVTTGQYEAWLEKGDIAGAWFAHDHVNNFEGVDDNGIRMGYNGGTGFRAYGNGDERSVRIFDIDENDVKNYKTELLYYRDLVGEENLVFSDILTPKWVIWVMKPLFFCFWPLINILYQITG